MRALGYPKLISIDSFRTPNFDLVADILLWLIKSYDPNVDIKADLSTEQDRVLFIKSVATFMRDPETRPTDRIEAWRRRAFASLDWSGLVADPNIPALIMFAAPVLRCARVQAPKAHIKLNTRKLYMADGYAVKELLKIADILYQASQIKIVDDEVEYGVERTGSEATTVPSLDIASKVGQLKICRTLASEITEKGATLYDLLGKELELRDIRANVISRPFEIQNMEAAVNESIHNLREQISVTKAAMENLGADESSLIAKIEKKKVELDRAEKRLKSLQGVRPAYMDEYEKIEVEVGRLYETYMEKFRNLAYLESQLDEYNRQEQDKFEETESSLKKMQNRLREEELRLLRGDKEIRDTVRAHNEESVGRLKRPKAAGRRNPRSINPKSVGGDSQADQSSSESEPDGVSLGSGLSDDDIIDDDAGEDMDDDEDRNADNDDEEEEDDDEAPSRGGQHSWETGGTSGGEAMATREDGSDGAAGEAGRDNMGHGPGGGDRAVRDRSHCL
ncbi:Clusterin-associated protein-1-domain-containing protein [Polychytrium aggregatum]|uniref:Clusterin-associated protein-1-domain-containing protein n=1 Tax=Polychytrium aggregatum TaxID=110093 RepID=UPI0022FE60D4|nr:Clusterin-associated protein-1-domain-containing protein [Polychytrium aggregatum]KAI9205421.1 Clusterin-associated protein-1-domain-containing protein [Polychytrium aggregatum]